MNFVPGTSGQDIAAQGAHIWLYFVIMQQTYVEFGKTLHDQT